METKWAEENLQTIRTLMERSAIYRRALAPIMLFAGVLGLSGAIVGLLFHLDSVDAFGALWLGAAVIAVAGAFLIARRQALKDKENFLVTSNASCRAGIVATVVCRNVFWAGFYVCRRADPSDWINFHLAPILRLRLALGGIFYVTWH
jgi:hypothetical protein